LSEPILKDPTNKSPANAGLFFCSCAVVAGCCTIQSAASEHRLRLATETASDIRRARDILK